jgi:broad specificity phosphatase PhoE
MATRLILVRHGRIPANVDHRWNGSIDDPLVAGGWFSGNALVIAELYKQ